MTTAIERVELVDELAHELSHYRNSNMTNRALAQHILAIPRIHDALAKSRATSKTDEQLRDEIIRDLPDCTITEDDVLVAAYHLHQAALYIALPIASEKELASARYHIGKARAAITAPTTPKGEEG